MRFLTEWNHVIKRPFSRFSRKYLASESRVIKFTWMLCRVQLDIHEINKIQKLRKVFAKSWAEEACLLCHGEKTSSKKKYLTSESRVKLAWTMPSAARYSLSKKIAKSWTEEACLLCRTQPNLFIKKAHYCSCDVWKDQETHLKVPRKASMKVTDKPWA